MIYQYINKLDCGFFLLLLIILLCISYSINNLNYSIKGIVGILIGIIIIWFLVDKKKYDLSKDKLKINNILKKNPLLLSLKNKNEIILFYNDCIIFSTFDYSNFKKSVIYFGKFIEIYDFILKSYKSNSKYLSYYYDILLQKSDVLFNGL